MTTDEELHQKAIAHELFCELSPKSRMVAIGVLRLLLVEETRPFGLDTHPTTVADVSKSQIMTSRNKKRPHSMVENGQCFLAV